MVRVTETDGTYMMCVVLSRPVAMEIVVTLTSLDGTAMAPGGEGRTHYYRYYCLVF